MTRIKILWFPDEALNQHIGRCFPRPSQDHYMTRYVLKPINLTDVRTWDRGEPYEMIELERTELQSRLIRVDGAEFWAWVHEEDGVWNV